MSAQYLLDTNVISETRKLKPNVAVVSFLRSAGAANLFLSVLTIGELRKGAAMKGRSDFSAGAVLGAWIEGLEHGFADRILGIDMAAARLWGEWSAIRSCPVVDTLLQATAMTHGLTLVTSNISDVEDTGVQVVDPWK